MQREEFHNEVMAMRGSRIAKQIEHELRREAKRKQVLLELRKRLLKERGESNGERTESSVIGNEVTTREERDSK
jgi:hypothetical protein